MCDLYNVVTFGVKFTKHYIRNYVLYIFKINNINTITILDLTTVEFTLSYILNKKGR